jgi:hypothetical protein
MNTTVSPQRIRTWMHRQRTLGTPSPRYLEWLKGQYKLQCEATVIKRNENTGH